MLGTSNNTGEDSSLIVKTASLQNTADGAELAASFEPSERPGPESLFASCCSLPARIISATHVLLTLLVVLSPMLYGNILCQIADFAWC